MQQVLDRTNEKNAGQISTALEAAIAATEGGKTRFVSDALNRRVEKLQALLPEAMKGQAQRLVNRAMLYFSGKKDVQQCPAADFIKIVLQAAEMGLALDGRLCHAAPFKKVWQCIPDYKGLIAVAKRLGLIEDLHLDVICEHDRYAHKEEGAGTTFWHERPPMGEDRGKVVGAYCRLRFHTGRFRIVDMDLAELEAIRRRAAYQAGPWSTDTNEMYKKTVCKRALKLYAEDPGMQAALEAEDRLWEEAAQDQPASNGPPVGRVNLRQPPAPVAEQPEPIVVEDAEALARQDFAHDITERLGACETVADLDRIIGEIVSREQWLGEVAQGLMTLADMRRGQITQERG